MTLRFSTFFPPTHQNAKITEESCKEVEKRTNGKVKARQSAAETTFVYIKMALADYAASIERLLGISVDKARTRSSSTHPYFDFSVHKVMAIGAGNPSAFMLGGDNTLEFMLTSINVTAHHKFKTIGE